MLSLIPWVYLVSPVAPSVYRKHQHKRRPRLALTRPEDAYPMRRKPYSPVKAKSNEGRL